MKKHVLLALLVAAGLAFACGDEEDGDEADGAEDQSQQQQDGGDDQEQPVIQQPDGQGTGQGATTGDMSDDGSGDDGSDGATTSGGSVSYANCGSLNHDESENRTRFMAATATIGLDSCMQETQTCTCNDGTVSCTGTYTETSCTESLARVDRGDLLVMRSRQGGNEDPSFAGGAILAFTGAGVYKGIVALPSFDMSNLVMTQVWGMKLEKDPFDDEYSILIGGYESGTLNRNVQRFPEVIDAAGDVELSLPVTVPNTGTVASYNSAFGFTAEASGRRYAVGVSEMLFWSNGGTLNSCGYDYAANGLNSWQALAITTGMGFSLGPLVARIDNVAGDFAIDRIGHCTDGGMEPTRTELWTYDTSTTVIVQDIQEFNSSSGGWHQSIFLGASTGFGDFRYWRVIPGTPYTEEFTPFTDPAAAVTHISTNGNNKTIWTLETDGTDNFIRSYDDDGALISTLYTDVGSELMPLGVNAFMVKVPE